MTFYEIYNYKFDTEKELEDHLYFSELNVWWHEANSLYLKKLEEGTYRRGGPVESKSNSFGGGRVRYIDVSRALEFEPDDHFR